MRRLLVLGAAVVGVLVAKWLVASEPESADGRPGATMRQRMMARMLEGMPPDSPPKLVMSILPRLREQNEEIIALLREQNVLLRGGRSEPSTHERGRPG